MLLTFSFEKVYNKFIDFGSVEISNYSHNEKGYQNTEQGAVISYSYAVGVEYKCL